MQEAKTTKEPKEKPASGSKKGDPKVLELLQAALSSELAAVSQYTIHGRMRASWGLARLARLTCEEAQEERGHAEKLIDRMLFLEGVPNMQKIDEVKVGDTVMAQFERELESERQAVKDYNDAVDVSHEAGDTGTAELFTDLLKDEEHHVDHLERQIELTKLIGMANFLTLMVGDPEKEEKREHKKEHAHH